MIDLKHLAAQLAFGTLHAEDIQTLVHSLLNEGVFAEEFIGIINANPVTMTEVEQPLIAYLASHGIAIPTKDDAVWTLTRHHISLVLSGEVDPIEQLKAWMDEVYWAYDFDANSQEALGDCRGLEELIGTYWRYEAMADDPQAIPYGDKYGQEGIEQAKKDIVTNCETWLTKYGN